MTVENFSECCPNHSTFNKRNATFFKVKYFSIKLVVRHCVFELQFCCYITWTFKLFLAHYCVFNPRNLTKNIKEYIYRIEETTGSRWRSDLRWNRRVKCRTAAILKSSNPGISTQSYTITNRPGVLTIWQKMSVSQRFGHPHSHIPSVSPGMPKTLIASTLPKLFQTGEKSGLLITNLRLNSVDAC